MPLFALLAALPGCGGSDKEVAEASTSDAQRRRAACMAQPPQAAFCASLCENGEEEACEQIKNACVFGADPAACFLLGQAYEREGDNKHANGAYNLACQGGQSAACGKLGQGTGIEVEAGAATAGPSDPVD